MKRLPLALLALSLFACATEEEMALEALQSDEPTTVYNLEWWLPHVEAEDELAEKAKTLCASFNPFAPAHLPNCIHVAQAFQKVTMSQMLEGLSNRPRVTDPYIPFGRSRDPKDETDENNTEEPEQSSDDPP